MKAPRFANNKAELARLAGTSRPHLYRMMRIPGFPRPMADGRWDVGEVVRFIQKSAKQIEGPNERDRLQMELLNLKIKRASQELSEFERKVRAEVTAELVPLFDAGPTLLKSGLTQMRDHLAPTFEGMNAGEIRKAWRTSERKVFTDVFAQLRKRFGISLVEPADNVVPFKASRNGNGTVEGKAAAR